jgi:uncharacterized damage-inducible protein DinB
MLQSLINYTSYADRIIIDTFLEANMPMPVAEKLFSHVLNAQHIWTKRVFKEEIEYDRFQIHSIGDFENIHLRNLEAMLQVLHTKDLDELIVYTTSAAGSFVTSVSDILFHVVNHSTYHRGQIVSQFRLNNITPPITDYVMLKRDGLI